MRPQNGSLGYVMWQKITPAWDAYGAINSDMGYWKKKIRHSEQQIYDNVNMWVMGTGYLDLKYVRYEI